MEGVFLEKQTPLDFGLHMRVLYTNPYRDLYIILSPVKFYN